MVNLSGLNSSISTGACKVCAKETVLAGDGLQSSLPGRCKAGGDESRRLPVQGELPAGSRALSCRLPLPCLCKLTPKCCGTCRPAHPFFLPSGNSMGSRVLLTDRVVFRPLKEGTLSMAERRVQLMSSFNHGQLFFLPVKPLLADKLHIRQLQTSSLLNCSHSHPVSRDAQVWDSILALSFLILQLLPRSPRH